jgi:sulfatase maturation enzyme AslB (radical SAM superfamily)
MTMELHSSARMIAKNDCTLTLCELTHPPSHIVFKAWWILNTEPSGVHVVHALEIQWGVRTLRKLNRRWREARMFASAMVSTDHPILAQVVPIRRCNLSCTYCNEFDKTSEPVAVSVMMRRIDRLAELGTSIISFSGGEPTLHPDLDMVIRRVRSHHAICTLITNGYFLTPERIRALNRAGLDYLQISIDNINPDSVSKKSLKVLDRKLQWLAEYAKCSNGTATAEPLSM